MTFDPSEIPDLPSLVGCFVPPSGVQWDVFYTRSDTRTIAWAQAHPEAQKMASREAYGVRVLKNGAQGVVKVPSLNKNNIRGVFDRALDIAAHSPADPDRGLAAQSGPLRPDPPVDPGMFSDRSSDLLEKMRALEAAVLKSHAELSKVIKFQWTEEKELRLLSTSAGVHAQSEFSQAQFMAEILAVRGGESEIAWDGRSFRFRKNLSMEAISRDVAAHAVRSLGGRSLPTGRYATLILPRVAVQLFSLLTSALSAESVQRRRSFLQDGPGMEAASPFVSLVDDPGLETGVASSSRDDEGMARGRLNVIEQGVLKEFFYDFRSARRDKRASNGRALRQSAASDPAPHSTNFFMKPGDKSEDELLSMAPSVFVLHDVMGLHMADPVTGEFSLGASGYLYENQRFSKPVRGVTIAGTVLDVLKNVVGVGEELSWYGSFGSPAFVVQNLMVSGQ